MMGTPQLLQRLRDLERDIQRVANFHQATSSASPSDQLRGEATHWRNVANGLMDSNDKLKENNAQLTLRIAELEASVQRQNTELLDAKHRWEAEEAFRRSSKGMLEVIVNKAYVQKVHDRIAQLPQLKITFGSSPVAPSAVNRDKVLAILEAELG